MNVSKEELIKIAHLSSLKLSDDEAVLFSDQIKTILDYADQLRNVPLSKKVDPVHNTNVFRDDVIKKSKSDDILSLAPEEENKFFVVPKILEQR
jgi:aspartyl-tRNA(Asn)/glutamyl-tRNA(Gln) amidotransferase subunit C